MKQYRQKRILKIKCLFENLEKKFKNINPNQYSKMRNDFLHNSKIKLPWSDQELFWAKDYC